MNNVVYLHIIECFFSLVFLFYCALIVRESSKIMSEEGEGQSGGEDPRIAALQQYTLKTMKQKNDKWAKVGCQLNI